jgi:hypothetical protein
MVARFDSPAIGLMFKELALRAEALRAEALRAEALAKDRL